MISNNLEWPFRLAKRSLRILKFYFCQNFTKKFQKKTEISWNSKRFLSQNRLERISIFRQKITHVFGTFVFWNIQFLAKITEILKTEVGLRKTDSLKSEIFENFLDQFWSELIALDRKVPRMWKFWNFRRFKKWPP